MILLDEPDSHLHASQQAVILDLVLQAVESGRQVVVSTHSPELISRVPPDSLRWIDRNSTWAASGAEIETILGSLGATPDFYIPKTSLPELLDYVEGITDRPIIEAIIKWCRLKSGSPLPTTIVIPHRDGRFDNVTLQIIGRFARTLRSGVEIAGIRDLDWYYHEQPVAEPLLDVGDSWRLLTLPCKELENLYCDSEILRIATESAVNPAELEELVRSESLFPDLVDEWRFQVRPNIRKRLPSSYDESTKERIAEETFARWAADPDVRRRLVAGKALLARLKVKIREKYQRSFYPTRLFDRLDALPPLFQQIADFIFPEMSKSRSS